MTILASLIDLAGEWQSTYRLLLPGEAPHESTSKATLAPILNGKFMRLDYSWAYNGTAQEGLLIVGYEAQPALATVAWIDDWHMGEKFMLSHGVLNQDGVLNVVGSFAVGEGPDWGWRTVIMPRGPHEWRLEMYNIAPSGEEDLGVEADYRRI